MDNKKDFAQYLRVNSTDAERLLWSRLRNRAFLGYKFRRQVVVGEFIVDFLCVEKPLVIELDGGQHAENIDYDSKRTGILNRRGFKIMRFWNNEVLTNLYGVLWVIGQELNSPHPR